MMRAKMLVHEVTTPWEDAERVKFGAVTGKPFDAEGNSEDNTYARWTPSGDCTLTITNPALIGKFRAGQAFYLDFTEASE